MDLTPLCTREVVGIDVNASLRDAAALMSDEQVGALVIVKGDPPEVVGLVTDRDLTLEVVGAGDTRADVRIGDLAKQPPIAIRASATLREAALSMEVGGVRRLLVVDDGGGVVGLVSAEDLLEALSQEFAVLTRSLRKAIAEENAGSAAAPAPEPARNVPRVRLYRHAVSASNLDPRRRKS